VFFHDFVSKKICIFHCSAFELYECVLANRCCVFFYCFLSDFIGILYIFQVTTNQYGCMLKRKRKTRQLSLMFCLKLTSNIAINKKS